MLFFLLNILEVEAQRSYAHDLFLCLVIQPSMRVTPLGNCLMVIVKEKPLNIEKTTSSVLSVLLLIYVYEYHLYKNVCISKKGFSMTDYRLMLLI